MELRLFQKDALVEKLAKTFGRFLGYVFEQDHRMQASNHPRIQGYVRMAFAVIEEVEFALADDEDTEIIKWQKDQHWSEEHQNYSCKYEDFTLTLLTSPNTNMTRVEVYLGKLRIHIVEKEITKEEATAELQEYLGQLAGQLRTLSRIEFWGEKE